MRPQFPLIASLILSLLFVHTCSVSVVAQKRLRKSNYGSIKIITNPGHAILINGKRVGETTDGSMLNLAPGAYRMEILFSKDDRWTRELDVVDGKTICIALNYRRLPLVPDETEIIERGDIEGTICECGETALGGRLLPATPLPPRKRTPKKP